jgi:hypothetical protein
MVPATHINIPDNENAKMSQLRVLLINAQTISRQAAARPTIARAPRAGNCKDY